MTIPSDEKNDVSGVSTNQPERGRIDSVDRRLQEMLRNRDSWEKKPVLQAVYRSFYKEITAGKVDPAKGLVVELAQALEFPRTSSRIALRPTYSPNPWLDRLENAYELNFNDSSIRNLILFDVFHHLKYPGSALVEFWRVVMPRGELFSSNRLWSCSVNWFTVCFTTSRWV
jgi:hypothetical protein